mmetsp:Transcript_53374/g.93692  ORF Transcript_53374/g.93692 Transcript_53374/m.93692 type:complete len:242 (-) Transcript_53374:1255-1980(-)
MLQCLRVGLPQECVLQGLGRLLSCRSIQTLQKRITVAKEVETRSTVLQNKMAQAGSTPHTNRFCLTCRDEVWQLWCEGTRCSVQHFLCIGGARNLVVRSTWEGVRNCTAGHGIHEVDESGVRIPSLAVLTSGQSEACKDLPVLQACGASPECPNQAVHKLVATLRVLSDELHQCLHSPPCSCTRSSSRGRLGRLCRVIKDVLVEDMPAHKDGCLTAALWGGIPREVNDRIIFLLCQELPRC